VLDSVVDHLDEMSTAVSTNFGDTELAKLISGSDLGQYGQERFDSPFFAARH
jgi:hypothetical protein